MSVVLPDLPVKAAFGDLDAALAGKGAAVLVAPPGAGKTTLAPLHLLQAPWLAGRKILLMEPRRLAARAAARRMASLLGEEAGGRIGYAMRMESRQSAATRILVVTEGVFARMAIDDPELAGIGAVIFDECHERSLDGDFGLALALDIKSGLRPDLRILAMSATLDGARVGPLMGEAPVIKSEGRAFPVEIIHRDSVAGAPIETAMAAAISEALAADGGSVLAFLPGQAEINRTARALQGKLPADVDLMMLAGSMDGPAQDAAIRPAPRGRRKVVLSTSIAETSVTIDGVRTVIDSGLSRVPRYDPATGLTELKTVRVSRASADQRAGRAGRAGRTEPGRAVRLWHPGQTAALKPFSAPEIFEADLSGLVLDCAALGVTDPARLAFLDPPPAAALTEARSLLRTLQAIDADGRLTEDGRLMRRLALPVRLAHMAAKAAMHGEAAQAALIAVLLTERGLGGTSPDIDRRLSGFRDDRSERASRARSMAAGIAKLIDPHARPAASNLPAGPFLLDAFPDRVARARGAPGRFVLANGRGATMELSERIASETFLVACDLQGKAQDARIVAAAAISEDDVRERLAGQIESREILAYDPARRIVRRTGEDRLGAIVLTARTLSAPQGGAVNVEILAALRSHGLGILNWGKEAEVLRRRLGWLHKTLGGPWPDMADAALLAKPEDWLLPYLSGKPSLDDLPAHKLADALRSLVPHALHRDIDRLAPTHFTVPTGNSIPLDYDGDVPMLSVRVQELFGLAVHPSIGGGKAPIAVELLSPAHRPIQLTSDLPGFWRGSWRDVRADLRGRYPRHAWPEDPANAPPTARAKPRGT